MAAKTWTYNPLLQYNYDYFPLEQKILDTLENLTITTNNKLLVQLDVVATKKSDDEDYGKGTSTTKAEAKAAKKGLVCVYPLNNVLVIDCDSYDAYDKHKEKLELVQELCPGLVKDLLTTVSTGGNYHRWIKLSKNLKPFTRVALQGMLGSDFKREALGLKTAMSSDVDEASSVAFETKDQFKKLKAAHAYDHWYKKAIMPKKEG